MKLARSHALPRLAALCLGLVGVLHPLSHAADSLSLAGTWRRQLDRHDVGVSERWFSRSLSDGIRLPGSLPGQGIGDPVTLDTKWTGGIVDRSFFTAPDYAPYREPGRIKVPFWLQPETYYVGAAWYQREITIPPAWAGRRVVLSLERPHWETRVWLGETLIGTNLSLSTPHEYDLGLRPPGRHTLTVRVDNRMVIDIGENSHSLSDHTQGNWNGIVGRIELRSTPPTWIDDLQFYPQAATRRVRVKGRVGNLSGSSGPSLLAFEFQPRRVGKPAWAGVAQTHRLEFNLGSGGAEFDTEFPLGAEAVLWDEFDPAFYEVTARLDRGQHTVIRRFGLRDFATDGTQFTINGRKTFIRGTLECAIFPRTGHTPTDVESWRKVIQAAQGHGLNNLRCHSHCPPEAAFVAADELGMYLHVECGSWANQTTTLGDGKPVDAWLYREADRILEAYGNHPSFVMLLYGNEPGGDRHVAYLKKWVDHYKAADPRRLYSSGAGWPQIPENQFHSSPDPRIQAWGGGMKSRINARPPETITDYRDYIAQRAVPVVSHEIGQWCVYPNFAEIPKYTGYLKPRNFEIFRDSLRAHGMLDQARQFLLASGKLQTLCYKEDIESALRTPGMGGFQLLDLHDFPGQGTALVGVLDPFWESKGYVTGAEYSRFCNATVPLARLPKRVYTTEEDLTADLEIAHFGPRPLDPALVAWSLVDDRGRPSAGLEFPTRVPIGNGTKLSSLRVPLRNLRAPARYRLVVSLRDGAGAHSTPETRRRDAARRFENDWDIWVYPAQAPVTPPPRVLVTDDLDAAAAALEGGGKVMLLLPPTRVRSDPKLGRIALGFSPIFWNTAWTGRQAPHTLGILCDPKHPALAAFPTDDHSNWQWWYLVSRAGAMILDDLPRELRPTVQVIDDWFTNRKLGLVFEAKVGSGGLLVCSIDLQNDLEQNPVARQLRQSLLRYLDGSRFQPRVSLSLDQVRRLTAPASALQKLGAQVRKADSVQPGFEADLALDGDPKTMWHTAWGDGSPSFPHELQVSLQKPVRLRGVTVLPRSDGNPNGTIKEFALYLSADGLAWGEPVAHGTFPPGDGLKTIEFPPTAPVRFLRLVALSGHTSGPWASVAELDLLVAEG